MPTTSPRPDPDDARPLSDHEHRILHELDHDLTESAPELAETFANARAPRAPAGAVTVDRVARAVAVLVVLIVVIPTEWLIVLSVIGVMLGAAGLGLWLGPRDPDRSNH